MRVLDTAEGYGWASILLHWITAGRILYLLYLGSSIGSLLGEDRMDAIARHTTTAMLSYPLLLLRVFWRFRFRHPGPNAGQRGWAFTLGKWTHYSMLVAIGAMLVSGPLMQWSYGRPIEVYDWLSIPAPFEASFGLAGFLHGIHSGAALFIFLTFLLHIGGVYKHTAFNQDGTLAKIVIPGRESRVAAVAPAPADEEGDR